MTQAQSLIDALLARADMSDEAGGYKRRPEPDCLLRRAAARIAADRAAFEAISLLRVDIRDAKRIAETRLNVSP